MLIRCSMITWRHAFVGLLLSVIGIVCVQMRSLRPFQVQKEFDRKLRQIIADGPEKLQIIADFDRTITTCFSDEAMTTRGMSAFGIIEEYAGNDEYKRACKKLFAKYYPIEIHANMTEAEKIPYMVAWYTQVHEQWYKADITRATIPAAVTKALKKIKLRPGFEGMVKVSSDHEIPLVIFSAGIGGVIAELLRQKLGETVASHIGLVSNWMKFSGEAESASLVGWSEPLIHMFNKDNRHSESIVGGKFSTEQMRARTNVILLGDGTGDATMADGAGSTANVVLKIGFLNEKVEERIAAYNTVFDAVVVNDGGMEIVNTILKQVCGMGNSKL